MVRLKAPEDRTVFERLWKDLAVYVARNEKKTLVRFAHNRRPCFDQV